MSTAADLLAASSARDLVPGDPGRLNDVAGLLQSYADDLAATATAFTTLAPTTWSGVAADRFRATFGLAPGHWRTASDAFAQASRAVSVYATSLLLAQDDAQDALVRYRRGTDHLGADAVTGGRGGMGAVSGADDPGAYDRELAVIALDEARERVRTAGTTAHNAVRSATTSAPAAPRWWQSAAAVLGALAVQGTRTGYDSVIVPVVNGVATISQSSTLNPVGTVSIIAGAVLVLAGGVGDAAGGAACATGVGCVAGAPAIGASTATVVTGWGLITGGVVAIGATASANPVTVVHRSDAGGGTTSGPVDPPRATAVPKSASPVWRATQSFRGPLRTNGLSGSDRRYYVWDHTHNDIELFDKNGRHLGTIDPVSGQLTKPAVVGRRLDIK